VAGQADRKIVLKDGVIVEDTLPGESGEVVLQGEEKNG
jgi:hypothetical protein